MKKKNLVMVVAIIAVVVAAAILAGVLGAQNKDDGKYTVGICQLVQHPALDQATQGFMDGLIAELGEENVEFDLQNASNDMNICSSIIGNFVVKNVDLIMANATPVLQIASNATKNIPILGTSITEYGVALEIENFNGTVGGNISGTSDLAPLDQQVEMIVELCPDAETVGIIYCSSEANSQYQVDKVTEFLTAKGITVKSYPFSDANDITAVMTTAAENCDAIYVPTDNTVATCAQVIGSIARSYQIPVVTGEENTARECGIASLTISYYDLGVQTGKMAAKVLKGEADISTMKIEYAPSTKKYNKEMCELLGIVVPEGYEEIK